MRALVAAGIAVVLIVGPVEAQSLEAGTSLRVVLNSGDTLSGQLFSLDSSGLTLKRLSEHLVVQRVNIVSVERRLTAAQRASQTLGVLGGLAGAVFEYTQRRVCPLGDYSYLGLSSCGPSRWEKAAAGFGIGALAGGITGYVAGSMHVHWKRVDLQSGEH